MNPSNQLPKEHHEYIAPKPAADPHEKSGYVVKEYEHQEYPKVVGEKTVNSAAEEAALAGEDPAPLDKDAAIDAVTAAE